MVGGEGRGEKRRGEREGEKKRQKGRGKLKKKWRKNEKRNQGKRGEKEWEKEARREKQGREGGKGDVRKGVNREEMKGKGERKEGKTRKGCLYHFHKSIIFQKSKLIKIQGNKKKKLTFLDTIFLIGIRNLSGILNAMWPKDTTDVLKCGESNVNCSFIFWKKSKQKHILSIIPMFFKKYHKKKELLATRVFPESFVYIPLISSQTLHLHLRCNLCEGNVQHAWLVLECLSRQTVDILE